MSTDGGRCSWADMNEAMGIYHDEEWGVPVRSESQLFERLTLEGAQAGLSWSLILSKREGYRRLFARFDPLAVARFKEKDIERLLKDPGIIRNRAKIGSAVSNARVINELHAGGESLAEILWSFVDGVTVQNSWTTLGDLPATTDASVAMSKELRRRGFRFVGPTTCYATMQAAGLVNDHVVSCPRWRELGGTAKRKSGGGTRTSSGTRPSSSGSRAGSGH
ncbi:MAG TPA: DNA-3-methyladenine glycosylase I [Acidimicrobiales bacterium]